MVVLIVHAHILTRRLILPCCWVWLKNRLVKLLEYRWVWQKKKTCWTLEKVLEFYILIEQITKSSFMQVLKLLLTNYYSVDLVLTRT